MHYLKMGQSRPIFVYFRSFLVTISIQTEKSIDGVLGIRTWGSMMVGTDETTELWRPPKGLSALFVCTYYAKHKIHTTHYRLVIFYTTLDFLEWPKISSIVSKMAFSLMQNEFRYIPLDICEAC